MNTKRTILSEKESKLLEDLLVRYGSIVSFQDIYALLKDHQKRQTTRNLVNKLAHNGWLGRIERGLYEIAGLESRGFIKLPIFLIAQLLCPSAYISGEMALQFHGFFDQLLTTVISISTKPHCAKTIQDIHYQFIKIKPSLYFGWQEEIIEQKRVKIATPEKAILDMLTFNRSTARLDLVSEKLRDYSVSLNIHNLISYSTKHPKVVQRILGFLLDEINVDTSDIYNKLKNEKDYAIATIGAKKFNAKWRLYLPVSLGN